MKILYATIILLLTSFFTNAQTINIPSPGFKEVLLYSICADTNDDGISDSDVDTNDDGEIQLSEALAVTGIATRGYRVLNLNGINAFANLKTLDCSGSGVSTLSIAGLAHLKTLNCSENTLYSLALSGLTELENLNCSKTQILTLINFSGMPNLKTLDCSGGRIVSLDVSGFPLLQTLNCSANLLTGLTVAASSVITDLNCGKNTSFVFDFSLVPQLKTLQCDWNAASDLNLSDLVSLEKLNCSFNSLTTLTLPNPTALKEIICNHNNLVALDLGNSIHLENLICSENALVSLDTSNATHLKNLDCTTNQLTSLNINNSIELETVNCGSNHIVVLNALNLANLKDLNCSSNSLTSLSVANLAQLKTLNCMSNSLPELDISGLSAVETIDCSGNNIAILNAGNLPQLKSLACNNNHIVNLNLAGSINLQTLKCARNELTNLTISTLVNLELLSCSRNQISAMDFSHLPKLWSIDVSQNLFTNLDFSQLGGPNHYYFYMLSYNPNLTFVNIKNGAVILHRSQHDPSQFRVDGCVNLLHVCVDDFNYNSVHNYVPATTQVNSYCSFAPGGNYNTISGTFTFDYNNNGCDANDSPFVNNKININDGTVDGGTFTNTSGYYFFYTLAGEFTVTPDFENPYFAVSPAAASVSFDETNGTVQTQNFCVTAVGVHNDVEISVLPQSGLRPGFDALYQLVYKNKGNQFISGDINVTFDDAIFDYVSSEPNIDSQSTNQLHWIYSNLRPFEVRTIYFKLNLNSPQEVPPVNIGDAVAINALINPISGDETVADNAFTLAQTVVGSVDPNDKTCLEGNTIAPEKVGDYLHYLIRFQNSGTAAAENIVVTDIIDTEKYDMASLQLTASSHPNVTKITGNKVEFQFQNILLPTASENEPGSHGFVAFKIKTKSNLAIGESVSNKADIYFDYNFPIGTEPATTVIALLAKDTFEDPSIRIFPNPVKDKLNITAKDTITAIELYDILGRLIETNNTNEKTIVFDISPQARGVYFVKIHTDNGAKVQKMIKE